MLCSAAIVVGVWAVQAAIEPEPRFAQALGSTGEQPSARPGAFETSPLTVSDSAGSPGAPARGPACSDQVDYTPARAAESAAAILCVPPSLSGIGVVLVHGGGGAGGSTNDLAGWVEAFNAAGHVTLNIDYHLYSDDDRGVFPIQEQQTKAAIQFLRMGAGGRAEGVERVVVFGVSHGGYLSALAGTTGDMARFAGDNLWPGVSDRPDGAIALYGYFNGFTFHPVEMFGEAEAAWETASLEASAQNNVDAGDPPLLVVHGTADGIVSVNTTETFTRVAQAAGAPITPLIVPDVGHGFDVVISLGDEPDPLSAAGHLLAEDVNRWIDETIG